DVVHRDTVVAPRREQPDRDVQDLVAPAAPPHPALVHRHPASLSRCQAAAPGSVTEITGPPSSRSWTPAPPARGTRVQDRAAGGARAVGGGADRGRPWAAPRGPHAPARP